MATGLRVRSSFGRCNSRSARIIWEIHGQFKPTRSSFTYTEQTLSSRVAEHRTPELLSPLDRRVL